jgi:hypothetical protein
LRWGRRHDWGIFSDRLLRPNCCAVLWAGTTLQRLRKRPIASIESPLRALYLARAVHGLADAKSGRSPANSIARDDNVEVRADLLGNSGSGKPFAGQVAQHQVHFF